MARVVAPGGRIMIVEPDLDASMIDCDDLRIAGAVRRQLAAGTRNPDIGRRLRRLLLAAGLEILEISGVAHTVTSLQFAVDSFHLFDNLDGAVAAGEVTADSAREWRKWIEAADASRRFCFAPVLFRALATKTPR